MQLFSSSSQPSSSSTSLTNAICFSCFRANQPKSCPLVGPNESSIQHTETLTQLLQQSSKLSSKNLKVNFSKPKRETFFNIHDDQSKVYQNSSKLRQTTTVDIQQICLILAEHKSSPTLFLHFLTIIGILHHDPIYLDIFGPYQFDICTHIDLTVLGSLYFDILIHIDLTVFDPYFDTFGPYYFDIWTHTKLTNLSHTDLTHLQFRWNVLL